MKVAYSPCPNDTFLFGAWAEGLVDDAPRISPVLADVEQLNRCCLAQEADLCKISLALLPQVLSKYILLPVGCALGWGVGPKVIAREHLSLDDLAGRKVAIPGRHTTACCLAMGFCQGIVPVFCTYDAIEDLVSQRVVDAGVIIHETRFTFQDRGFVEVADLGGVWEERYRLPLPLGGIVAKRQLGQKILSQCAAALRRSLEAGDSRECREYILRHSREKDASIVQQHIATYVGEETRALSRVGEAAIRQLLYFSGNPSSEEFLWREG